MVYLFLSLFFSIDAVCPAHFSYLIVVPQLVIKMSGVAQYDTKLGENAFITKAELRPYFQGLLGYVIS